MCLTFESEKQQAPKPHVLRGLFWKCFMHVLRAAQSFYLRNKLSAGGRKELT